MGTPRKKLDEWKDMLRSRGLRATAPRLAVLGVLSRAKSPMSHAEVAEALENEPWDMATVYRNLIDLSDASLVRRSDLGQIWRFEATFLDDEDAHELGHPHFVCTDCGTVACVDDVEISVKKRAHVPKAVKREAVEIQLRGLCDDCG